MKIVGLDNFVNGTDDLKFDYNHDSQNYDFLIGKQVRGDNLMVIGVIEYIDYYTDGFGHEYAVAVCGNGRRFNCRIFFAKR